MIPQGRSERRYIHMSSTECALCSLQEKRHVRKFNETESQHQEDSA